MKGLPRSPFRPTFGVNPPTVAGREEPIAEIGDAFEAGPGAAARITLATGARGIGKTVLLNAIEDEARRHGWLVINETLSPGILSRLEDEHVPEAWRRVRAEIGPDPARPRSRRRLTGITLPAGLGGVSSTLDPGEDLVGLRPNLTRLCDVMTERGAGVLLTVDEIHKVSGRARGDFETVAGTIQHLWREERDIAFLAAGLPAAVQDLLTDDVTTFLRRAERITLETLTADEAADALAQPVRRAGREISAQALARAVEAAAGYPYMVQIVGDLAWRVDPRRAEITLDDVESIVPRAIRSLGEKVHRPAVADLSAKDRDFLLAMVPDGRVSQIADVIDRLGVDHAWASRYRQRLLVAGMIRPEGRGRIAYALPYLREFLAGMDV
ncbi:ATP-binding protein [Nocardioides plantarum]|uniref:AAA family ATPase n=1 Tax=Nocardioides plantarum TaxID=29299 RepID=A0ABV5K9I8_9ACTN|nr:ATP-binding protein [Nocardioides plantarum]